jgi:hypothetical protein
MTFGCHNNLALTKNSFGNPRCAALLRKQIKSRTLDVRCENVLSLLNLEFNVVRKRFSNEKLVWQQKVFFKSKNEFLSVEVFYR